MFVIDRKTNTAINLDKVKVFYLGAWLNGTTEEIKAGKARENYGIAFDFNGKDIYKMYYEKQEEAEKAFTSLVLSISTGKTAFISSNVTKTAEV